jgi:hypothetical protein
MQFPRVKSVTAIGKYKLFITFFDSTEGEYDVSNFVGKGVFRTWDIDNNFFKVSINPTSGAITWSGELDIDTINAYCTIKGVGVDEYLRSKQHYVQN